jgi:peroxiredoxin
MIATLLLVGCTLTPGQTADRADWLLAPRLVRAQELLYSGSFSEESSGAGVQFSRSYRLQCRILVLDTGAKGSEIALLTVLKARDPGSARTITKADAAASSVRLELAKLDARGRLSVGPNVSLSVPLEGPPTLECGAFVETPRRRVGPDQSWEVGEDGRPMRLWKITGAELVDGVRCVKLLGTQQSEDWDKPRGDHTAWRRLDTVWLDPVIGVAHRLERTIERRDPARQEPTHKSILRYDLESNMQYPRQLFDDRGNEIHQARVFTSALTPLVSDPAKHFLQLDALLAKIKNHLDHEPPTPYREAVQQVKRRAEAARRGESLPVLAPEPDTPTTVAVPGRRAPDFLTTDLLSKEQARLKKWLGRPIVLVFYSPASDSARELLRFAQRLAEANRPHAIVIGLAMSDDTERVHHQHDSLQLSFPILAGTGLRQTYDVASTPKFVVIDGEGVVRAAFTGWGQETPDEVSEELKRCLPQR